MDNPLISVIIPTYNSAKWICDAVDSVINQTYKNIEIIVVDDGSTDNTASLLNNKYGNTILYIYQENSGPSKARNTGIVNAKGKYVQFLDADDILLPNKITLQVQCLESNPEYSAVYSDFEYLVEKGGLIVTVSSPKYFKESYATGDIFGRFLNGNFIVCHSLLLKLEDIKLVGLFNENLNACEDFDLWLRMAAHEHKFFFLDNVLLQYRNTPDSLSSNNTKLINGSIYAVRNIRNYLKSKMSLTKAKDVEIKTSLSTFHSHAAYSYFKDNKLFLSAINVVYAICYSPARIKEIYWCMCSAMQSKKNLKNSSS